MPEVSSVTGGAGAGGRVNASTRPGADLNQSTSGVGADPGMGRLSSGISRSGLSVSSSRGDSDDDTGFELSSAVTVEPVAERALIPEVEAEPVIDAPEVELTEAELQAPVDITLEESETVMLFSLPSLRVLQDTEEFGRVTMRNEKYAALCQLQSAGGDNYSRRHTQTLNNAQKNKDVSATPAPTRDVGVTAAAWDIFDAIHREDATVGADADVDVVGQPQKSASDKETTDPRIAMTDLEKAVDEAVSSSIATPGCLLDAEGTVLIAPPLGWEDPSLADPVMSRRNAKAGAGNTGVTRSDKNALTSSSAAGMSSAINQSSINRSGVAPAAATAASTKKSAASDPKMGATSKTTKTMASSGSRTGGPGTTSSGSSHGARPAGIVIPTKAVGRDGAADGGVGGEGWTDSHDTKDILLARETARVLASRSLLNSLRTVERALQQNVFHNAHRMYKAVSGVEMLEALVTGGSGVAESRPASPKRPQTADVDLDGVGVSATAAAASSKAVTAAAAGKGRLVKLWSYSCPLSQGRSVTGLAWNRINPDLLAVSYGDVSKAAAAAREDKDSDAVTHPGIVLFWSMSNPGFPQATLYAKAGVTSIAFSGTHPNLIAAGLQDGSVCIYDVKKAISGESDGFPDLMARPLDGSHTDAVWQLQWIEKSQGRGERLVSISADGKVKEWSTKKGLVCTDLMLLKRVRADGTEPAHEEKTDGVISRVDAGLCFDFPANEPSLYYTGTEDGVVHHCSVSYGEQLESFRAHTGPVYRLRISPFMPQAVLTCSADWSVKLWDIGSGLAPCVFQTTDSLEAVMDVCWSKTHSTRFASVTGDGRVMLWDTSSFTPLIDHHVDDGTGPLAARKRLTTVLFANDSPVLVTGDVRGSVDVYRVVGLPPAPPTFDEQVDVLSKSLHPA